MVNFNDKGVYLTEWNRDCRRCASGGAEDRTEDIQRGSRKADDGLPHSGIAQYIWQYGTAAD